MMATITVLGRIALIDKGHILLAHQIGADNTFLPGGHVEQHESVERTILRELKEEFDGEARIGQFLGVVEDEFQHNGLTHYALNLVFTGSLLNINFPTQPQSRESHLEFYWRPIKTMEAANVLPSPLIPMIFEYYGQGRDSMWLQTT